MSVIQSAQTTSPGSTEVEPLIGIDQRSNTGVAPRTWHRRAVLAIRSTRAWMLGLPVDAAMIMAPALWAPQLWTELLVTSVLTIAFFSMSGRYTARLHLAVMDEIPDLLRNMLSAVALVAIVVALRSDGDALITFLVHASIAAVLLLLGRAVTTGAINASRRRGITRHRTVILGGGVIAADLAASIKASGRYGLKVVGFVDRTQGVVDPEVAPRLGDIDQLGDAVREARASVVLIADGDLDEADVITALQGPGCASCDVLIVPRLPHLRTQTGREDHIATIPVMRLGTANLYGPTGALKRAFDATMAALFLLALAPVLGLFALLLRLESGPGVIFRQARIGRDGELFECLKLRSMKPVDETESATNWNISEDERVTRLGSFIRRTSIDELPQLWNVLRGDMSLVGPRPERPFYVEQFSAQYVGYSRRHRMRVGLTGMAQVSGLRGDTSIAERARHDNYYIENWSLWLDVKIMVRTFSEVLFAKGA